MIVVPLKEGENIEKALKKFRKKVRENRCSQGIKRPSGFRETVCYEEKADYACYLRTAFATSRRIIIASGLVLLNSYSYFRCMNVDATRIC